VGVFLTVRDSWYFSQGDPIFLEFGIWGDLSVNRGFLLIICIAKDLAIWRRVSRLDGNEWTFESHRAP